MLNNMETECSVVNCGNTSSETKVFYKFPLAFDMCMQWLQNTGNQKLLQDFSLGGTQILEKYVCSDHFLDKDFAVFGQAHSGLRCQAVPLVTNLKRKVEVNGGPKPLNNMDNKTLSGLWNKIRNLLVGCEPDDSTTGAVIVTANQKKKPIIKEKTDKKTVPVGELNLVDVDTKSFTIVDAVPISTRKKKHTRKEKKVPALKISLKDVNTKSFTSDGIHVTKSRRKKPSKKDMAKEKTVPIPIMNLKDPFSNSFSNEEIPLFISIKEEPDVTVNTVNTFSYPFNNPDDANMTATYEAYIRNSKKEPEIMESKLPLPCASFNLDGHENPESGESLLPTLTPKIEKIDIEEVLLPDSLSEYDESLDMETAEDQFRDLPEYYEDVGDPSLLLDISGVEYLNPIKKEQSVDRKKKDALRQAMARLKETPEQRAQRLEKTRIRAQERRQSESEVETTIRRYKSAVRAAIKRSTETEEEKKDRQEKNKIRAAERRKNMTPAERALWREKNRIQTRERRERETEIKKIVRRYNNAVRASIKRSGETSEQRMERRLKDALRAAERRKMETPEERQERLRKDRERITLRRLQLLMSETPEQREERLRKDRERMYRKRHGLKKGILMETSNDETDSQVDSEESLSAILCMYPPKVEIQTLDEADTDSIPPNVEIQAQDEADSIPPNVEIQTWDKADSIPPNIEIQGQDEADNIPPRVEIQIQDDADGLAGLGC